MDVYLEQQPKKNPFLIQVFFVIRDSIHVLTTVLCYQRYCTLTTVLCYQIHYTCINNQYNEDLYLGIEKHPFVSSSILCYQIIVLLLY